MKLHFKYGPKYEIQRIKQAIDKLKWYKENGYNILLPKELNEKSSRKKIVKCVEREFEEEIYRKVSIKLQRDFSKVEKRFFLAMEKYLGFVSPKKFYLFLTNYGTGGSYSLPNKIVYNINNSKGYLTILHEIVHLAIQKDIVANKVSHWKKERIVDLILNSREFSFLKYSIWQKDYHGAESIDSLFKKYFFNDKSKFYLAMQGIESKP